MKTRNKVLLAAYIVMFLFILFAVSPYAWLVLQSFQTYMELAQKPPRLAPHWEDPFQNYGTLVLGIIPPGAYGGYIPNPPYWVFIIPEAARNSVIVAVISTFASLALASPSAFTFAKTRFKGKNKVMSFTLLSTFIPTIVIVVPLWLIMNNLHLIDTVWSVIILYTSFLLPYNIWMLTTFFESLPNDLIDAATVDGCNRLQTLIRIVMPLSKPALGAVGIFNFILCWNEFLIALIMTKSPASYTLPVVISMFSATVQAYIPFNLMLAAGVIGSIFPIVFVLIFQKYLVKGLLMGSFK